MTWLLSLQAYGPTNDVEKPDRHWYQTQQAQQSSDSISDYVCKAIPSIIKSRRSEITHAGRV